MDNTVAANGEAVTKHDEKLSLEQKVNMLLGQMAKLQEENEKLLTEQRAGGRQFILKVSDKGAVTVNDAGIRRFGVTLYAGEWEKLFSHREEIEKFIQDNKNRLSFLDKKK